MPPTHALPELDPGKFPNLAGIERPFFEYWWQHLVQPDEPNKLPKSDPQSQSWRANLIPMFHFLAERTASTRSV